VWLCVSFCDEKSQKLTTNFFRDAKKNQKKCGPIFFGHSKRIGKEWR